MESIENICELSQGASWIQKVDQDRLIVVQNNQIYDQSFGYSEGQTVGMTMEEIPFEVAHDDVKRHWQWSRRA
jgi:hypothetical protein